MVGKQSAGRSHSSRNIKVRGVWHKEIDTDKLAFAEPEQAKLRALGVNPDDEAPDGA